MKKSIRQASWVASKSCLVALVALCLVAVSAQVSTGRHHHGGSVASQDRPATMRSGRIHISGTSSTVAGNTLTEAAEKRVRKRSKWLHQQSTSPSAGLSPSAHQSTTSSGTYFNKDGSFLKRIVTEVIAERDAQIAAALFEVAKNQPHLQMMVQTLGELSQSNQRLELSSTRLDETQRRLDSRLGVISEKLTLLESRLSQTERRVEREMTHIHGKMDEIFRNLPDKSTDSLIKNIKQIQEQLNVVEEIVMEKGPSVNHIRSKSRHQHHQAKTSLMTSNELQKMGNSLSQAIAAIHLDLGRTIREAESSLDHQLSMLASDNGVFSCAMSRLLDRLSQLMQHKSAAIEAEELLPLNQETNEPPVVSIANANQQKRQLVEGNSIQTADLLSIDQLAGNATRCLLKCP